MPRPVVIFTDFGVTGPYVGQMKAAVLRERPGTPLIDLFLDAPAFDPRSGAYLLAAYASPDLFRAGSVFLCVVDPGVGGARLPLIVEADGRWYVGPDNGLFEVVVRGADAARCWTIGWRPSGLSASFHGRDLFAPVAARLARGESVEEAAGGHPHEIDAIRRPEWPDALAEILYVDAYGNAITGIPVAALPDGVEVSVRGHVLRRAATFSDVSPGEALWYENSSGLLEIAVNQGRADVQLGLREGIPVTVTGL